MKLTCLSKGDGTYHFPPSHILQLSGFRILLECPLDLLSLAAFSPLSPDHPVPLVRSTPFYKTHKNLHLEDPSHRPCSHLHAGWHARAAFLVGGGMFEGRVYATETARTGRLMMEELVEMNDEYVRFYGWRVVETPDGLKWEEVERMASVVRGVVAGRDGDELASWILGCLCTGHLLIRMMRVKQKLFNQLQRNFGGDQQDQFHMLLCCGFSE